MNTTVLLADYDALALFDRMSTAVLVADSALQLQAMNAAAEDLLALSAVKAVNQPLETIFEDAEGFIELVKSAQEEERSFTDRDMTLRTSAFHAAVVDCTVTPLGSGTDEIPPVMIELTSVERHQRIQSEEHMILQSQMTAALMQGLAHEVKNPIGGIRGAAQLLERELDDQRLAEYTQIIIGEADRLRKLVERMLGPRGESRRSPVNIHDVLEHVRQVVEAEKRGTLAIERDYDPSLPNLTADRDQLVQAFLNIVRNAAQAVDPEDGQIVLRTRVQRKVTVAGQLHRLVVRVQVIDNGLGVAPEIAESIFVPMVSGRAEGSGLGLPISQAIINRGGGLIGFESEPGRTVFNIWLPLEG